MTSSTQHAWTCDPKLRSVALNQTTLSAPAPDEVQIRNLAIGINPVDWKFIQGNPLNWPAGHVPGVDGAGVDGAGVIEAIGADVDPTLVGQRVAYHHALSQPGSFGHFTNIAASKVMRVPEHVALTAAAALPCPLLTAWQAISKVPSSSGARILAAGMGAVNKLTCQLAHLRGFEVDVISGSLSDAQAAQLNIRQVYRDEHSLTRQYYAAIDARGEQGAAKLASLLKANGHIVAILGRVPTPIDPPFTRAISYHEVALGGLHEFGDSDDWQQLMQQGEQLLEQVAAGQLSPAPIEVFEFTALNDALTYSQQAQQKAGLA
ncbi:alcohol dehydrogenase catalytic domain-containing protein [Aliagarivorans taiwanensis]|uniref:alcohol dehydrogenase catalytic domain-containing protein n=1 Tax=Aliagarivorans taiwanensis TaxID=561966 RepID=UPI0003FC8CB1|nr:alcohol dehydrogenase catalytic domain-containing protein [Aliagarivorans taiwanensis]